MLTQTTNLFHASLPDVESRIVSEGILLNHQGLINLSGFASHAAGYVNLLGCVRIEGVRITESEPHVVQSFFDTISVFHIDTDQIDTSALRDNTYDREQSRYGLFPFVCSSFTYPYHIPPTAITSVSHFEKNDIRIPMEFYSPRSHG
jgi:hypothetical protein